MKHQLIYAALLAGLTHLNAQFVTTNATPPANSQVFKIGNASGTIHYNGGSGGLVIGSGGGDRALFELHSPNTGSGNPTNRTVFQSLSSATYLDVSYGQSLLVNGYGGGKVGFNNLSPNYQVDIKTSVPNDGLNITQTGGHASALHLTHNSGNHWALFSTGPQNNQGNGNFAIYDYGANLDRLFINGSTGNCGIGSSLPTTGRLVVRDNNNSNTALHADARNTNWIYGQHSYVTNRGILAEASLPAHAQQFGYTKGIKASASEGMATGGEFFAYSGNAPSTGIYAEAYSPTTSYEAAFFNGPVYATFFHTHPSDRKLKEDIKPLTNAMDKIALLKPSTYKYKEEFATMHLPKGNQMGFIAQEFEQVFPELVREIKGQVRDHGEGHVTTIVDHKAMSYTSLIPLLIAGVQEQQSQLQQQNALITTQQQQITELKKTVESLLALNKAGQLNTGIAVSVSDKNSLVLNQNVPNPFAESTVIGFNIPDKFSKAQLQFMTNDGRIIKTIDITDQGEGSITVFADDLSNGTYTYSLVVDGKVVDSKKMVKD